MDFTNLSASIQHIKQINLNLINLFVCHWFFVYSLNNPESLDEIFPYIFNLEVEEKGLKGLVTCLFVYITSEYCKKKKKKITIWKDSIFYFNLKPEENFFVKTSIGVSNEHIGVVRKIRCV